MKRKRNVLKERFLSAIGSQDLHEVVLVLSELRKDCSDDGEMTKAERIATEMEIVEEYLTASPQLIEIQKVWNGLVVANENIDLFNDIIEILVYILKILSLQQNGRVDANVVRTCIRISVALPLTAHRILIFSKNSEYSYGRNILVFIKLCFGFLHLFPSSERLYLLSKIDILKVEYYFLLQQLNKSESRLRMIFNVCDILINLFPICTQDLFLGLCKEKTILHFFLLHGHDTCYRVDNFYSSLRNCLNTYISKSSSNILLEDIEIVKALFKLHLRSQECQSVADVLLFCMEHCRDTFRSKIFRLCVPESVARSSLLLKLLKNNNNLYFEYISVHCTISLNSKRSNYIELIRSCNFLTRLLNGPIDKQIKFSGRKQHPFAAAKTSFNIESKTVSLKYSCREIMDSFSVEINNNSIDSQIETAIYNNFPKSLLASLSNFENLFVEMNSFIFIQVVNVLLVVAYRALRIQQHLLSEASSEDDAVVRNSFATAFVSHCIKPSVVHSILSKYSNCVETIRLVSYYSLLVPTFSVSMKRILTRQNFWLTKKTLIRKAYVNSFVDIILAARFNNSYSLYVELTDILRFISDIRFSRLITTLKICLCYMFILKATILRKLSTKDLVTLYFFLRQEFILLKGKLPENKDDTDTAVKNILKSISQYQVISIQDLSIKPFLSQKNQVAIFKNNCFDIVSTIHFLVSSNKAELEGLLLSYLYSLNNIKEPFFGGEEQFRYLLLVYIQNFKIIRQLAFDNKFRFTNVEVKIMVRSLEFFTNFKYYLKPEELVNNFGNKESDSLKVYLCQTKLPGSLMLNLNRELKNFCLAHSNNKQNSIMQSMLLQEIFLFKESNILPPGRTQKDCTVQRQINCILKQNYEGNVFLSTSLKLPLITNLNIDNVKELFKTLRNHETSSLKLLGNDGYWKKIIYFFLTNCTKFEEMTLATKLLHVELDILFLDESIKSEIEKNFKVVLKTKGVIFRSQLVFFCALKNIFEVKKTIKLYKRILKYTQFQDDNTLLQILLNVNLCFKKFSSSSSLTEMVSLYGFGEQLLKYVDVITSNNIEILSIMCGLQVYLNNDIFSDSTNSFLFDFNEENRQLEHIMSLLSNLNKNKHIKLFQIFSLLNLLSKQNLEEDNVLHLVQIIAKYQLLSFVIRALASEVKEIVQIAVSTLSQLKSVFMSVSFSLLAAAGLIILSKVREYLASLSISLRVDENPCSPITLEFYANCSTYIFDENSRQRNRIVKRIYSESFVLPLSIFCLENVKDFSDETSLGKIAIKIYSTTEFNQPVINQIVSSDFFTGIILSLRLYSTKTIIFQRCLKIFINIINNIIDQKYELTITLKQAVEQIMCELVNKVEYQGFAECFVKFVHYWTKKYSQQESTDFLCSIFVDKLITCTAFTPNLDIQNYRIRPNAIKYLALDPRHFKYHDKHQLIKFFTRQKPLFLK